ncbi:DUF4142 domain-containing protein [Peteryoungia desertarenae]|uniref:DUF4142 domain-containing protein n=1 Tax=Peteryoungia desertarenae TaxID=1813451 RepID=A0ABX6QIV1_9HYPH|nr:DUF4142 domain-containing protein [Peteryoungia desertarenae]QLF68450.1 DUF4142 domain-containing protein [Peteryoungia desertarenae]
MKRLQVLFAVAVISLVFGLLPQRVAAQDNDPAQFAERLAVLNTYLREASELAIERAQQDTIRNFALTAIDQDRNFAADLAESAMLEGVMLDDDLDQEYASKLEAIRQASDETFDMAYISAQVTAYESMVELIMPYIENGPIGQLKAFASDHISGPRSLYNIALNLSRTQAPLPAPVSPDTTFVPSAPAD